MLSRAARTVLIGLLVALIGFAPPPAQAAPATCQNPRAPQPPIPQTPWPQRQLGPERAWPFADGTGVTVAVVDSGTDPTHPQLRGRVLSGFDFLRGAEGGDVDCISHGTAVASIIAAQRVDGIGFRGVAPGARILPVRISEQEVDDQGNITGDGVDVGRFAEAIRWAADRAEVINLSLVLYQDDPRVRSAIAFALTKGVVVVAAVGNQHEDGRPDPVPYPAAYDGVIGVGAVAEDGSRVAESQVGPYVDLVAPGGAVVGASRLSGHALWSGTSFAAPFVSATAALVRAYRPQLTGEQVAERLLATAGPATGGAAAFGRGTVDPYRAVTDELATGSPAAPPPVADDIPTEQERARADEAAADRRVGIALGLGGVALAAAVLLGAVTLRRGRRRGWRPTRARPAPEPPELDDPAEDLFARRTGAPPR